MGGFAFELEADETAVLELKLGQYIKGDQGATGPTGPAGPQGELSPDDKDYITQQASIAQTAANNASGSATSAAQSASQAQTASTQAQAARDAASQSATTAQTQATNAANSASNAAASAATAQSQATNAATSATNAKTSETNAAASATNAANSAAAALASQNAAAGSATAAANSATAAATSATNAKTSETNAAASAASASTDAQRAEDAADVATGVGGEYEIDLTAGNVTLDDSLSGKGIYRLVGAPNADRTVTFSGLPNTFVAHNLITTGFAVTLAVTGGTATAFAQKGDPQNFMADATGVYATSATAQSTAPNSIWYTVGASDAVGSFAQGDTFIRTPGFVPPFVRVIRNGAQLTRGQHYTLRADNIHVDFVDPLTVSDEIDLQTQATASASSVVNPALAWLQPAAGATFVAFTHTVGFAWPMLRGQFLELGTDYTEDATGFTLVGFAMDGTEKLGILALGVATMADVLASNDPAIKTGGLHFPDGSVISTAPLSNRNIFVDGAIDRWDTATSAALPATNGYVAPTMWTARAGTAGAGTLALFSIRNDSQLALLDNPNAINVARFALTTASTGTFAGRDAPLFMQRVERADTGAARTLTISAKLRLISGAKKVVGLNLSQVFGSSFGSLDFSKALNWTITNTFKKFSARIDVPAIQGGQNFAAADYLACGLMFDGAVGTIDIAELQLEPCSPYCSDDLTGIGGAPTAFEYRGYQAELARVQRHYETGNIITVGYWATTAGSFGQPVSYRVSKRSPPALSFNRSSQGGAITAAATTLAFGSSPTDSFTAQYTTSAAGGYNSVETYIADARL